MVSAQTVDTPPAFESRECHLFYFFKDFDTLFHLLGIFLSFKFDWVVNNAFFCGVTNTEHIFNIVLH